VPRPRFPLPVRRKTYLTASYRARDFSPAEWDSPEKRARIANYEQVTAETDAGRIGPGAKTDGR
jgi:hypothetical protein